MRKKYAFVLIVVAAMTTPAWPQISVRGIEQNVEAGELRSLVIAQFFDLQADPAARFVERVTQNLLDRPAAQDEILIGRDRLRGSTSADAFIREMLRSDERLGLVVDAYFQRILDRLPDAAERPYNVGYLAQGNRESDLVVELFTAQPYLSAQSEIAPQAWLDDMFTRLTGRAPTALESSGLMMLLSMNYDYQATVQVIANSDAVRTLLIAEAYRKLLLRDPTAAEIAAHLAEFSSGMSEYDFRTHLLLSAEYAGRDVPPIYTVVVDWGDGFQSDGIILPNIDGGYVVAEHTYGTAGIFTVSTTVSNQFADSGSAAAVVEAHDPPAAHDFEILSLFASYLDGPAATGLLPGETTGDAEGAYAEDPISVLADAGVVAGTTDASGATNGGDALPGGDAIVTLPCGFGAPAALAVTPLVMLMRRRGRTTP